MQDFNKRYIEFCKPFIDSLIDVYETMLSCKVNPGKPGLRSKNQNLGFYSSIMGISGVYKGAGEEKSFKGSLTLCWPKEVYLKSASAMLMEEFTEFSDEIEDVGLEITNITMGNAKKFLNDLGYFIEMSIPNSVIGNDHHLSVEKGVLTINTPLSCEFGNFCIELNYSEK